MQDPDRDSDGGVPVLESPDLDGLLVELADALAATIGVRGVSLKLVDAAEETVLLRRGAAFRPETLYGTRILAPTSFAAEVLSTGATKVVADLAACDPAALPAYALREGFRSLVAAPLPPAQAPAGVLTLYLARPIHVSSEVLSVISLAASALAGSVRSFAMVRRIESDYFSTVEAMVSTVEAADPCARGHSQRVTGLALAVAARLGVSGAEIRDLRYGATLHDVGKIGIGGQLLNKKGKLTREEYDIIKQHPIRGECMIRQVTFLQGARPIVRSHHEKFDGTGYPDGLRDEEIPMLARVAAVADFFDAMTSSRPYRKAYSAREANLMIKQGMGREFDPMVAKEFLEISWHATRPAEVPIASQASPAL
ncbi:MAG: HD-GYP domain-containing protein [bacterium]